MSVSSEYPPTVYYESSNEDYIPPMPLNMKLQNTPRSSDKSTLEVIRDYFEYLEVIEKWTNIKPGEKDLLYIARGLPITDIQYYHRGDALFWDWYFDIKDKRIEGLPVVRYYEKCAQTRPVVNTSSNAPKNNKMNVPKISEIKDSKNSDSKNSDSNNSNSNNSNSNSSNTNKNDPKTIKNDPKTIKNENDQKVVLKKESLILIYVESNSKLIKASFWPHKLKSDFYGSKSELVEIINVLNAKKCLDPKPIILDGATLSYQPSEKKKAMTVSEWNVAEFIDVMGPMNFGYNAGKLIVSGARWGRNKMEEAEFAEKQQKQQQEKERKERVQQRKDYSLSLKARKQDMQEMKHSERKHENEMGEFMSRNKQLMKQTYDPKFIERCPDNVLNKGAIYMKENKCSALGAFPYVEKLLENMNHRSNKWNLDNDPSYLQNGFEKLSKFSTKEYKKSYHPFNDVTDGPVYMNQPFIPVYNNGITPGNGRGITSGNGRGITPSYGRGITPGYGRGITPGYGRSISPGYGHSILPGYGHSISPGYGHSISPGYGHSISPGYGHSISPGYGHSISPGYSRSISPGYGRVRSSAYGSTPVKRPLQDKEDDMAPDMKKQRLQ